MKPIEYSPLITLGISLQPHVHESHFQLVKVDCEWRYRWHRTHVGVISLNTSLLGNVTGWCEQNVPNRVCHEYLMQYSRYLSVIFGVMLVVLHIGRGRNQGHNLFICQGHTSDAGGETVTTNHRPSIGQQYSGGSAGRTHFIIRQAGLRYSQACLKN